MPTVKADLANRVDLRPVDARTLQVQDVSAGARAIAQGGASLGGALGDAAEAEMRITDMYDEAAVARADTLAMTRLSEARRAAMSAEGFDAQTAQTEFTRVAEETQREIAESLSSPRQRSMFGQVYARRVANDGDRVAEHATRQVLTARREASTSRITTAINVASEDDSPEAEAIMRAVVEAELPALLRGAAPEVVAARRAALYSTYRAQTAERLATTDPIAAQQYVDEHAGEIEPEAEVQLRTRLRPRVDEAMVEGAYAMLTAGGGVSTEAPEEEGESVYAGGTSPPADPNAPQPAAPPPRRQAAFRDPLRGRGQGTSSAYGVRRGNRTHGGVDYPAAAGTPVYPPAGGRVVASFFDSEHGGGNTVIVEHPDGRRTGYAHLRTRTVGVGDEVNEQTVLGGVGSTGRSTGPHLHFSVRDAEGNRVDPTTQTWGGEGSITPRSPSRAALGDMYARAQVVAEEMGLNQRQYRDLLAMVDRDYTRQESVIRSRQEIAADEANAYISERQDQGLPVELSTVPGYADMSPSDRRAMGEYVRNGSGRDGSDTYFSLMEMSANPATQQRFAQTDLNQYRSRISQSEYAALRRDQLDIRHPNSDQRGRGGDGGPTIRAVAMSRIEDAIALRSPEIGLDAGGNTREEQRVRRRNSVRLQRLVRDGVRTWQENNPGQPVPDEVIDFNVRFYGRTVTIRNQGGEGRTRLPVYGITNYDGNTLIREDMSAVPARDQTQIRDAFRRQHGRLPTDGEVVTTYLSRR